MDIKIVGTVTDENGLDEIENIMKIFAYEQRMKDYMSFVHTQPRTKEVKIFNRKIPEDHKKIISNAQQHILVKGLC